MKILTLSIKQKYFDEIMAGTKNKNFERLDLPTVKSTSTMLATAKSTKTQKTYQKTVR